MKRCTVLWQTAVLHFALQDGGCCRSSSSGGRVLREGAGISAEEDSRGRRRHTSATKNERKAQRYKGLAKGWYRSGGGKPQGSSGDHEPSPDCPRGCHPDPAPGYGFYLVPQVRGSDDSTRPLSSSRGMASRTPTIVGKKPLRDVLFLTTLKNLSANLKSWQKDAARQETSKKQGWITAEGHWLFQKWDPDTRALIVDNNRPALTTQAILDTLSDMMEDVLKDTLINRFHSTRKLTADTTGVVAMIMDVSLRKELGGKLYWRLQTLQANAAWQTLGIQYKPESLHRSPLAAQVQRMAYSNRS